MGNSRILSAKSPVSDIRGIGPKKAAALRKLGISDMESAAYHYPRSYEDLRHVKKIAELANEEKALVSARVLSARPGRGFGRKRTLILTVEDDSGRMQAVFFSAAYMASAFIPGKEFCFFGKVKLGEERPVMFHPSFFPAEGKREKGIVPVYPTVSGISQKDLRKLTLLSLECLDGMDESLPESVIKDENLCGIYYALKNIHYPKGENEYRAARYRLIYEELFYLASAIRLSRERFGRGRGGNAIKSGAGEKFAAGLPYALTAAQRRVLCEVLKDMASQTAMNRLLQGDVGCGKTVVAEAALAEAAFAGYQSAFMAPTELLAKQHYETLSADFAGLGIKIAILTGSCGAAKRRETLSGLADGSVKIVVGTHALISEGVRFEKLGLVITDEQHRFGVNQRKVLTEKGENPDVLVMTATPIPRTLAVVLYGDLDLSVIDEMPPGRKKTITERFSKETREAAYGKLLKEVEKGRQAYIVAPFIDDSESLEGHSAEGLYDEFTKKHPDIKAALLHGEMSTAEKDGIMSAFSEGKISVLISTVVIEVGINVPNASIMLIENAERFGLAQLHQLRGRVGRGSSQSYCFIVSEEESEISKARADLMCRTESGFEIAEKDLEMRGPGEIFGFRQHGLPALKLADPARHFDIAERAAAEAEKLFSEDPGLSDPGNAFFAERIKANFLGGGSLTL